MRAIAGRTPSIITRRRGTPLASSRCRRFALGKRVSWVYCWIFGQIPGRRCHLAAMGRAMTLPLYGTAAHSAGFRPDKARSVVRLRAVDNKAERQVADFALAKTPDEVLRAMEADWPAIFIVSDDSLDGHVPGTFNGRLGVVSRKYGYLGDGDVLGFDHSSRKFRTLFRRNSAHNSFLVTERCNNYCLMCSQPPKDVDDRWIL